VGGSMDPFEMLKDSFDKLSEKVYKLIEDVAGVKATLKILVSIFIACVTAIIGLFFYIIQKLIELNLAG
jgi:hypothetical protein